MRILVNCTTNSVGGGVQVALSFIQQVIAKKNNHTWLFCVSPNIYNQLFNQNKNNITNILPFNNSPAKLVRGINSRNKLRQIECDFKPNVVFTILGPSYVNFKAKHLCGCALGWSTHGNTASWSILNWTQKIKITLRKYWDFYYLNYADYYWVEAEVAQKGLSKKLNVTIDRIKIFQNTYSPVFELTNVKKNIIKNDVFLLTLAAPYLQKNLIIIPHVAKELLLKDTTHNYVFNITIPQNHNLWSKIKSRASVLGVSRQIYNLGVQPLEKCPGLYLKHHFLFMPTLLETFTATYLEAMKMERPIITTDLDFAHDICGSAACYYPPFNAENAAEQIIRLVNCPQSYKKMVESGLNRLKVFPTPNEKYQSLVSQLEWVNEKGSKRQKNNTFNCPKK